MNKLKYLFLLFVIIFTACSDEEAEKREFLEIYKDILVAREMYADSARGNEEVALIFKKHNYNEPKFRELYFSLAKDRNAFMAIIDTAREWARIEIDSINAREGRRLDSIAVIKSKTDSLNPISNKSIETIKTMKK